MTILLTNDELQAIRARCEAATPIPILNIFDGAVLKIDRDKLIDSISDIPALLAHIAEQRWALSVLVEALEKTNAKERENALVEALEEIKNDIEDCDECRCDEVLVIARTALARVKGK